MIIGVNTKLAQTKLNIPTAEQKSTTAEQIKPKIPTEELKIQGVKVNPTN